MQTKSLLKEEMIKEILKLKKERNAIILAHNYQLPEVQDIADFIGDSLGLSQAAAKTEADIIVFCGVNFMAETASILCPNKKVLIPDINAGCSLASTITAKDVIEWKKRHPNAIVVAYINTTADVKAEADYCCTSSNAVKIISSIPKDKEILFIPDMFLGAYVIAKTGRKMHLWPGECHVHAGIKPQDIIQKKNSYPNSEFLIHPECGCTTSCMFYLSSGDLDEKNTHFFSTEGMIKYVKNSPKKEFLIATEVGILHRMKKLRPDASFIPIKEDAICQYMKMITLDKVLNSLRNLVYEVKVPKYIADKARKAIQRMLEIV